MEPRACVKNELWYPAWKSLGCKVSAWHPQVFSLQKSSLFSEGKTSFLVRLPTCWREKECWERDLFAGFRAWIPNDEVGRCVLRRLAGLFL